MAQDNMPKDGSPLEPGDVVDPPAVHAEDLDEVDIQRCLDEAEELKQEGNDHFRAQKWNEALAAYRSALGRIPKRKATTAARSDKGKGKETLEDLDKEESSGPSKASEVAEEESTPPPVSGLDAECAKARATMNANIGACYVKLGEHKEVVAACTEALLDDPQYIKAMQRRASSNDKLDTWASLTAAQQDYNTLLTLLPPSSPQIGEIRRSLHVLTPRLEAAQKRETSEMLDKLKGLGNSILGNFGLSTDNFQFVPNGQGGYSMNFAK